MKLSIIIPAHNEMGCIENTLTGINNLLRKNKIPHELLVINDNSTDRTEEVIKQCMTQIDELRYINNSPPNGFGLAIRKGLDHFLGEAVAIVMADGSDSPEDIVKFYRRMEQGYECVFGTRWQNGGNVTDYPFHKYVLNRMTNLFISLIFALKYDDVTNAFKMYRSHVISGLKPILSNHFNLTVELPLKSVIRGYSYSVLPNSWMNRQCGESKLKIKEMGSRYLFIILYCFIEKWLSRGDYKRNTKVNYAKNMHSKI
jgi:dolichol-phosphate mannosyltransferase